MNFDVLIIGGGGAGLMAALEAAKSGANAAVFSKTAPNRSQSVMAQGGINAALGNVENDSIQEHIDDTIKGGAGLTDRESTEILCKNAPEIISFLDSIGMPFSRSEDLKIDQRSFGGASRKRTCFSSDMTGHAIVHTLYDQALSYENLKFFAEHMLLELLEDDKKVCGAKFIDIVSGKIVSVASKAVIIATGGYASIFFDHTTNTPSSTGDGILAALKAGADLKNMEFVQFHPTTLKNSSLLISEAARGEGAYLLNSDNERFVNELDTRDIVTREIQKQIDSGKDVFLDLRHLDSETIEKRLRHEIMQCRIFEGIEPKTDLVPIKPSAHYTMGGVDVDIRARAKNSDGAIKGLYVCGEAACSGVHGANRLGGNSLLEILVFGKIAAAEALLYAKDIDEIKKYEESNEDISRLLNRSGEKSFYRLREEYSAVINKKASVFKDKKSLAEALEDITRIKEDISFCGLKDKSLTFNTNLTDFIEFKNILEIAQIYLLSALNREESRGSHIRSDFPQSNDDCIKNSIFSTREKEFTFKLL